MPQRVGDDVESLFMNGDGTFRYQSTVNCTGSAKRTTGQTFAFAFDCGTAKFTGTAKDPAGGKSFVMTWEAGDTSTFHAAT